MARKSPKPSPIARLLRCRAGAEAGHLGVLRGVAELVHDHVGVLAVIDAAVAHVQRVVGGRVERVVVADAVHVDRHRPGEDRGEAEAHEVALHARDRGVGDGLLERVLGAGVVVVARTRLRGLPGRVGQVAAGHVGARPCPRRCRAAACVPASRSVSVDRLACRRRARPVSGVGRRRAGRCCRSAGPGWARRSARVPSTRFSAS